MAKWQSCRLLILIGALLPVCRKDQTPQTSKPETPVQSTSPAPVILPTRVDIPVEADDSDRWLHVQKVADKARGGWATGSFDPVRNKLSIQTSDIEEFTLNTSRVAINWKKLVILSIDGKNSELRKRDYDTLLLARTPHGEWIVREP